MLQVNCTTFIFSSHWVPICVELDEVLEFSGALSIKVFEMDDFLASVSVKPFAFQSEWFFVKLFFGGVSDKPRLT